MALNFSFLNPYPSNSNDGEIVFETEIGNKYEIYFSDGDGYFEGYPFAFFVKIIGFRQLPPINSKIHSKRIAETIMFHIVEFLEDEQNILGYVCDQSDDRQSIRKKLFDVWYLNYNTSNYVKFDFNFEPTLFFSFITKRSNPFLNVFQESFDEIKGRYK